jgi:hypothetical protein
MDRAMIWLEQPVSGSTFTMSEPRYRDDDVETDKTVDMTVPDDAGRIIEIETPYQQSRQHVAMERKNDPTDCPFYNSGTSVSLTSKEPCEILNSP